MAKRKLLVDASELEAIVAEDPADASRWSVLEDFLLERGDPRAAIIEAELRGRAQAEAARGKLMGVLFGKAHVTTTNRFVAPKWRGGYLRRVEYFERSMDDVLEARHFEAMMASPATRLLEELRYAPASHGKSVVRLIASLPERGFATALRDLTLVMGEADDLRPVRFDLGPIARLPRLARLAIHGPLALTYQAPLARLRALTLAPLDAISIDAMLPARGYPELAELDLDTYGLQTGGEWSATTIRTLEACVLSARATPKLAILRLTGPGRRGPLIAALADSPILPQLRELHLHSYRNEVKAGIDPARLGKAFAHLERVVLPRTAPERR